MKIRLTTIFLLIFSSQLFSQSHQYVNPWPDEKLKDIENISNYRFLKGDIADAKSLKKLFTEFEFDGVIHLAAESHVDQSIKKPFDFAQTNVMGTLTLLETARKAWEGNYDNKLFYHVSTDEVYGSLGEKDKFLETTSYDPRSPYSASKAASDHFVRAYFHTFGLPVILSNCSNNYGPDQYPEKLIPLIIQNIVEEKPLPVYGNGKNIRDWIYVEDHVEAIDLIFNNGKVGATYNVGGNNEICNIEIVNQLIALVDSQLGRPLGYSKKFITFVTDRLGHDYRYAIDSTKIEKELGWTSRTPFQEGLEKTVISYLIQLKAIS